MLLVLAVAAGALVVLPSPAHAQYQTTCGFIIDPPVVPVDGQVTIIGSQFGQNNTVQFFIARTATPDNKVLLGTATSDNDPDGNLRATFPLPAGFNTDGEYLVTVTCPQGDVASNVLIVGLGTSTTVPVARAATTLPVTGDDSSLTLARIGVVAVALGGIVLLATRRQRRTDSSA
jgi:LPXTG-motif cell wall-anchored protein